MYGTLRKLFCDHYCKSNECPKNRQKQTKSAQVRVVVIPTPKQPKLVKGRVGSRARRADILKMAHDHPMVGHLAYKKMISHLKRSYTWPGIGEDVLTCCKSCAKCQKMKSGGGGIVPLHP